MQSQDRFKQSNDQRGLLQDSQLDGSVDMDSDQEVHIGQETLNVSNIDPHMQSIAVDNGRADSQFRNTASRWADLKTGGEDSPLKN